VAGAVPSANELAGVVSDTVRRRFESGKEKDSGHKSPKEVSVEWRILTDVISADCSKDDGKAEEPETLLLVGPRNRESRL
jgi:hypothetical protein